MSRMEISLLYIISLYTFEAYIISGIIVAAPYQKSYHVVPKSTRKRARLRRGVARNEENGAARRKPFIEANAKSICSRQNIRNLRAIVKNEVVCRGIW